jgi:tetratricopeptide (TPR) repeat protein
VIGRFDGHVAQYLGDGILAYFGFPQAHEDDAERALRAGLGIVSRLEALNERLDRQHGLRLRVRVGVHTGPVVVGEMGDGARTETLAMGETTNLAARLQDQAEPDTVVMSPATLRLVQGIFVTRELGERSLKGIAEPVRVIQVVRATGVRSRLDVAAAAGLTPLVGRDQELGLLDDRWAQVKDGWGQAVLISGEAGIGKSRLVQAFRERIAEQPHTWLECRCSPYTQDSTLYPVEELHRQGLAWRPEDPVEEKLARLEAGLEVAGFDLDEAVPPMAAFHGIPLPEHYPALTLSPEAQRRKTLELLAEWLLRLGRQQHSILLMEDLHWLDPSTLELLGQVLEQVPRANVLLLCTFRPDFEPPWGARSHVTPLLLSRLTRAQLGDLIRKAAGGRDVPDAWVDEIVRRSDGVPLFAEELTKAVLESNPPPPEGGEAPTLHIPETLQDSLTARIDELGPVKEIAQLASVLGREFAYDLLLKVSPLDEERLRRALADAVTEELFYQRGTPPDASYLFKHALIRDAAYQSMLRRTREQHHRRVAQTLTERVPRVAEAQPEVVAHHWDEAGEAQQAIEWWSRAGEKALTTLAASEAERSYGRGVRAIRELPESPENTARELELQIGLGAAMHVSRGWGSPDVRPVWERVHELASAIDSRPNLALATVGLASHLTVHGQTEEGIAVADQAIEIAEEIGDEDLLLLGLTQGMMARAYAGRPLEVVGLGERAVPLLGREAGGRSIHHLGADPVGSVLSYLAMANAVLGHLDEALRWAEKAIEQARRIGHPNSLCVALVIGATGTRAHRRELRSELLSLSEETLELAETYGLPLWAGVARAVRGVALAIHMGDPAGAEAAREGLAMAGATGTRAGASLFLRFIAEAELRLGRVDAALEAVASALAVAEATGQHFEDAYLHGVRGEALRERDPEEAEAALRQGLEIARHQSAKSPELRVATELARLWRDQGRSAEARSLLAPVYEWFSEGLDTPLLQNAEALLEELA